MHENRDVRQIVVIVDDVSEIGHALAAFVGRSGTEAGFSIGCVDIHAPTELLAVFEVWRPATELTPRIDCTPTRCLRSETWRGPVISHSPPKPGGTACFL